MDMIRVRRWLEGRPVRLIGPNCPGIITPGACKIGIMPGHIHRPGTSGRLALGHAHLRSGRPADGARHRPVDVHRIGGDPVGGVDFVDVLTLFNADPDTHGVIMIGEIGGQAEERAAAYIRRT